VAIAFYDAEQVERLLDYPGCILAMRRAMQALSQSGKAQPLRQIVKVSDTIMFGVMPGDLAMAESFGAKLVSVAEDPARRGRARHRGVVVSFATGTAEVECVADAEAVTSIRTACATAAATDALARPDAAVLAILGTGTQAETHIRALRHVRSFRRILLWGRSAENAAALATRLSRETGLAIEPVAEGWRAAGEADVICTVSGSAEPILFREWVRDGTHVNLVGSSLLGPVEIDTALVAAARYIADYRPGALAQAAEFVVARDAGAVTDDHVVGEIGEVFAGTLAGRERADQITIYKSLGHVVQDLAAASYLHARATSKGTIA
jgi:ornithine cyclodeaminase